MKRSFFLMICSIINLTFFVGVSVADDNQSAQVRLGELIRLQKQTIQTYEDYRFNVDWVGGNPIINIVQQQVNLTQKKVNMKNIVLAHSKLSPAEESKTAQELANLKKFKASKYVQVEVENRGDEDDRLLRFDAYDSQGHIRVSEWRSVVNGFTVESVFFTEGGKAISLFYCDRLRFNQPFSDVYSGITYTTTLEHALQKFGPLDSNDPQDVIKLCEILLDKALSKNHNKKH